jgi:predicted  nucleic acid-binding Zn-ribbon protein
MNGTSPNQNVVCTRCGQSMVDSYEFLGRCECGNYEWEYCDPNPMRTTEEVKEELQP